MVRSRHGEIQLLKPDNTASLVFHQNDLFPCSLHRHIPLAGSQTIQSRYSLYGHGKPLPAPYPSPFFDRIGGIGRDEEPLIIETFGDGTDPASRDLGAIKEEHRRITSALPYRQGFARRFAPQLPLLHDRMFHGHDELPVSTGHAHPEAKRGRYFKEYIAFHSTSQSIGSRTPRYGNPYPGGYGTAYHAPPGVAHCLQRCRFDQSITLERHYSFSHASRLMWAWRNIRLSSSLPISP